MNFDIIVAHVNHMIREEAIEDQKFVENFCKKKSYFLRKKYRCSKNC